MNRKLFLILLIVGTLCRVWLLCDHELVNGGEVDVYLADEGIVGLMGKHILEGREFPIFFYGQHYLGALEAYLAAFSFALFGVSTAALRAVTFASSFALLACVYVFTRRSYCEDAARWATAMVALGPMYFLQWNFKARGGFVEHLVLLFVIMILFWGYAFAGSRSTRSALWLGLVSGLAFWVNQLALAYIMVMGALVALDKALRQRWKPLALAFVLGASLLIGYNVVHPLATFRTLARKAVVLNRVPVEQRDQRWLVRGVAKRVEALSQGVDKLAIVFGVPPRAGVELLGLSEQVREGGTLTTLRQYLAFLPLLIFGAGLVAYALRLGANLDKWRGPDGVLLVFMLVTFVVGYVSPRYMLPAYPIAAVMAAATLVRVGGSRRRMAEVALAAVLVFNLLGWVDVAGSAGRRDLDRIAKLLDVLQSHGLTHCYSAGPMYHVVFASGENVILAPLQKDRYPRYSAIVDGADDICYVFRGDQQRKRQHLAMMALLEGKGVDFQTTRSGSYQILYAFEPRGAITPEDMANVRHQERARVDLAPMGQ